MKRSGTLLHLQPSLEEDAKKAAEQEGIALDQFINVAVAEKLAALRTRAFFAERRARADIAKAKSILARAGVGNPPESGDEIDTGH